MDIRKISLHLSGKVSPYEKYSRLEFFDYLEDIFGYNLDKLDFYWKQAKEFEEEFYYLVFDKLYSKSKKNEWEKVKLEKLLLELDLPSDIYSAKEWFNYKILKKEFDEIITKKTSQDTWESQLKWKQFEVFLQKLFNEIEWLEISKIKVVEDEQIDLVIKNNINKPFWLNLKSPVIIWEAKNRSKKTNTEVINTLRGKSVWHTNLSKIGIVIAMNWFTKAVDSNLLRDWASERVIVAITWDDINNLLVTESNPIEWLEWLIMKSFV